MNYAAHYDRLMARARGRVLDGYRERHHVLPRCMGGDEAPGNLVYLTPEEHYVAHQLLVKMHPNSHTLACAANLMATRCTGNKPFGWLRRRNALSKRGIPRSSETRAKLSSAHRGKVLPAEQRAKISASNMGRIFTPETRAKIAAALRGMRRPAMSAEHRAKIASALRGVPKSPEHREKAAAGLLGNTNTRGKKLSSEHRAKLSAATREHYRAVSRLG